MSYLWVSLKLALKFKIIEFMISINPIGQLFHDIYPYMDFSLHKVSILIKKDVT